jgi:WD40 repeat protein
MKPLPSAFGGANQPRSPFRVLSLALFAALIVLAGGLAAARSDDEKKENKPDEKEIKKLIDQLGDDDEKKVAEAEKKLLALGEAAIEPVKKAIKDHPDADVRLRAIVLLKKLARGAYRELFKMTGHTGWIRSIAVSKDGKRALTGSQDHTMRLWDLTKGTEIKTFKGHTSWTWQVCFSPDEKQALSSGGVDGTLKLWDIEKGSEEKSFDCFPGVAKDKRLWCYAADFSRDGKYVLGSDAGVPKDHKDDQEIAYSIRLFDVGSGKQVRQLKGHTGYIWRAYYSPDGKRIASVGANDRTFRIWDPEKTEPLVTGKDAHEDNVVGLAWTPDSKQILTSGRDQVCKLWDAETGKLVKTITGFGDDIEAVAFSKDGKRFLAGGTKVVHLVDVDSAKIVHRFEEHTDQVLAVAFLPDGRKALSAGKDNTLRLWSVPK